MNQSFDARKITLALVLLIAVLVVSLAYTIISSISLKNSTVPVSISSSNESAIITISQTGTEAAQIGTGNTVVRLKPGSYYLLASAAGERASQSIQVKKQSENIFSLELTSVGKGITTAQSVNYVGFNSFIDNGLTQEQVANIKQIFSGNLGTVGEIYVNKNSVKPGPRNPESILFSLTFSGTIDSKIFTGTVRYSGFDYVIVTATDSSGKTIIDDELPESPEHFEIES